MNLTEKGSIEMDHIKFQPEDARINIKLIWRKAEADHFPLPQFFLYLMNSPMATIKLKNETALATMRILS